MSEIMQNNTYITPEEELSVKDSLWKATAVLEVAASAYNVVTDAPESIRERVDDICNVVLDYVRNVDAVIEEIISRRVLDNRTA